MYWTDPTVEATNEMIVNSEKKLRIDEAVMCAYENTVFYTYFFSHKIYTFRTDKLLKTTIQPMKPSGYEEKAIKEYVSALSSNRPKDVVGDSRDAIICLIQAILIEKYGISENSKKFSTPGKTIYESDFFGIKDPVTEIYTFNSPQLKKISGQISFLIKNRNHEMYGVQANSDLAEVAAQCQPGLKIVFRWYLNTYKQFRINDFEGLSNNEKDLIRDLFIENSVNGTNAGNEKKDVPKLDNSRNKIDVADQKLPDYKNIIIQVPAAAPHDAKHTALLLDYEEYFNIELRDKMLAAKFPGIKIDPVDIYSPHEVIGAYLKSKEPSIDGDVQVVDIDPGCCHTFTLRFVNGRYALLGGINSTRTISLNPIPDAVVQHGLTDFQVFDSFLENTDNGVAYSKMVWDGVRKFENGDKTLDDLIAVFDDEKWASVRIADLVAYKSHLLTTLDIDISKPVAFVGILSAIFSAKYSPTGRMGKLEGFKQIVNWDKQFYSNSLSSVALEIFCYPVTIKVPLYEKNSRFDEYVVPKQTSLINSGKVTFYRDDEKVEITPKENLMKLVDLDVYMDGNQNMVVVVDKEKYLL